MSKDEILGVLKRIIKDVISDINTDDIDVNLSLKDYGANSVDRMEIITLTLRELNLKIPLVEMAKINNIEGLVNFLSEKTVK